MSDPSIARKAIRLVARRVLSPTLFAAALLSAAPGHAQTDVPSNWSLLPADLTVGDEFRLLGVSKLARDATSTDIADYDTHLQDNVTDRGHGSVSAYGSQFKVLGSTATVDMRDHTAMTGTGVAVYWLNGARIADDYDDFYDGSWSNRGLARFVNGTELNDASHKDWELCTGSTDAGEATSNPLGGNGHGGSCTVTTINRTSSTLGGGTASVNDNLNYMAISPVFRVASYTIPLIVTDGVAITSDPGDDGEYVTGDVIQITVTFSEAVTVTGTPRIPVRMDSTQGQKVFRYSASGSTSTALVFSYTVADVDSDSDGIQIGKNQLVLGGGSIKAGEVDAVLDHPKVQTDPEHKVHIQPSLTGASVTSTPSNGSSYVTGETIQISATFDRAVQVVGTIAYRISLNNTAVDVPFAQVAEGNVVQFERTVAPDDYSGSPTFNNYHPPVLMDTLKGILHASANIALLPDSGWRAYVPFHVLAGTVPLNADRPVIAVDGVAITSTPTAATNTYGLGETVNVSVTFSKAVTVDTTNGTPRMLMGFQNAGSGTQVDKYLDYVSGSGTSTLVFQYTVQASDEDDDGIFIDADALDTNQGTIRDDDNTDAGLRHDAPGDGGDFPTHKVDGSLAPTSNNAPVFANASTTRSFTETVGDAAVQTAAGIGAVVTATDADTDTLSYSLEGTDAAKFTIVSNSGQIQTKVGQKYDREAKMSYSVTVKADDGNGGSDTIAVTINVDNATEAPIAPAAPSVAATSGVRTSLDVSWTAPANTGRPNIASYDLQYKKTTDDAWTDGPQDVAGASTSTTIASLEQSTSYQVQVRATNADGDSSYSSAGSGTTNANNAPVFAGATVTRSFTETVGDIAVQTAAGIGAVVTATDADNDTLTYSLEGTDAAKFTIVSNSGQIQTKVGQSYDREAKTSYSSVIVKADDGNGGADTITVTINVDNATEAPIAPAAPVVSANGRTSLNVNWAAPNNAGRPSISSYDLQYRQGSGNWTDGPQDVMSTTATIEGLAQDTSYEVHVRATNSDGDSTWSEFGAGGTNANSAPAFTEITATRSFTETIGDLTVQTAAGIGAAITAPDADNDTLTYSLEGTNATEFTIVPTSGQIQTKVGQNYDREAKDTYSVIVKAEDGNGGDDTIAVTINVDNTAEAPLVPAAPTVSPIQGSRTNLNVTWVTPNNAGRPPISGYDLQYREGTTGAWTTGPQNQTGISATIVGLSQGTSYEVQVQAANTDGDSDWSGSGSGLTNPNSEPAFASVSLTRSFTETIGDATVQTAAGIGAAVTGSDADNDTLTHSLEGTDEASFTIVSTGGQIQTKVGQSYDREAKASYSVIVKIDDNHGGTDTIAVTINIDNEIEAPVAPAPPSVSSTAGTTTSLDVTWSVPNNTGRPVIGSYDLQYREGSSGAWTDGPQDVTGTNSMIQGLEEDTPYEVQLRATNGDGDSSWSTAGSGRTNEPANIAPSFANASATLTFTETEGDETVQSAADIGAAITATDADNDTLTYSLEGADEAKFTIVPSSGDPNRGRAPPTSAPRSRPPTPTTTR